MIFSSICVQINTMFTKKEFKVAELISTKAAVQRELV